MPTFTAEDLRMSAGTLDQLTAACANAGVVDPVLSAINAAIGQVDLYAAGYALTDDHYGRLMRALAAYELYRLACVEAPSVIDDGYKAAMRELEAIRDGKFPALAKTGETPGSVGGATSAWGSETRINIRSC